MRPTLQIIAAFHIGLFIIALYLWTVARAHFDGRGVWLSWKQHNNPWCERDRAWDFAREPSNSLADFPYLAVALFMAYCAVHDLLCNANNERNDIVSNPIVSASAAVVNLLHFVGTWMNHSCRCYVGHVLDCTGMYSVLAWFGLYGFWQLHKSRNPQASFTAPQFCAAMLLLYGIFLAFEQRFPGHRVRDVISLGVVLYTAYFAYSYYMVTKGEWHTWLVKVALGLSAVAGVAWILDTSHIVCKPDSWIQGHAIFHHLTAIALLLAYLYVRSQRYATVWHSFTDGPLLRETGSDIMLQTH